MLEGCRVIRIRELRSNSCLPEALTLLEEVEEATPLSPILAQNETMSQPSLHDRPHNDFLSAALIFC